MEAIKFVTENTGIPTPCILEKGMDSAGRGYFKMEYIPGDTLRNAWQMMGDHEKQSVVTELRQHVAELRSLKQEGKSWIGSCSGGCALDQRINNGNPFGPLANEKEFNDELLRLFEEYGPPELVRSYRSSLREDHNIVFTHGDLSADNILVDPEQGRVTAILDWETAGWMPEYWEYRKALYGSNYEKWWRDVVHGILQPFIHEYQLDSELEWC